MISWRLALRSLLVVSLLFLAIPIHVDPPDQQLFDSYRLDFNKTYNPGTNEYNHRFRVFQKSLTCIKSYNGQRHHEHSAKYGLTEYSDMTEQEFAASKLNKTLKYQKKHHKHYHDDSDEDYDSSDYLLNRAKRQTVLNGLPLKMDWRETGIISAVKDQGMCGACWAFSTVHTIEAMNAKKHRFIPLSVQQVIDCAVNGNRGCSGGDICSVLEWISDYNVTLETEKEYPYTSSDNLCHVKSTKDETRIRIKNYQCQNLVASEKTILRWLANYGPVAVAVNALSWQNYIEGVVQFHCDSDPALLNHAIQIVGYDLTAEIPYYIAKNSWGTSFGDDGYIYLAIGKNTCGLANEVVMVNTV